MISPEDEAYYFTCPDNDCMLPEQDTHTPTSGNCVPSIQWKEDLMDVGGGTWHAAQDIHTAPLILQNHPTSTRRLVVQVKAQNAETFVAMDRATITLYKAQDRPRSEYMDSIHAAVILYGGDDSNTFKRYLTAILCHESRDKNEGWPIGTRLNQYAWRSRTDPNEYCNPLRLENLVEGRVVNTDWGVGQINDRWNPDAKPIYDPQPGRPVIWNSVDIREVKYNPFYNIKLAAALLKRAIRFQEYNQTLFGGISQDEKWGNTVVLYHRWKRAIFYSSEKYRKQIPVAAQNEMIRYLNAVLSFLDRPCY